MYTLREVARLKALVFLVIGTVGLLVNEFAFDCGRVTVLILAAFNLIGLATLAFLYWRKKDN